MNYKEQEELSRIVDLKESLLKGKSGIKISNPICTGVGLEFILTYKTIRITFSLREVDKVEGMVSLLLDEQNEWKKYI